MKDMFRIIQIEFDLAANRGGVSADYLNAGHGAKSVQKSKKSHIEALRETGRLRFEIGGQRGDVRICYHTRGQMKDVLRVTDQHQFCREYLAWY